MEKHIVTDLQYGSCGKGLFAGFLATEVVCPDTIVTAWAPNAGHTYIDGGGRKYVNIALPNGMVAPSVKRVLLGPGSTIDPNRLTNELHIYAYEMEGIDLMIHENAMVLLPAHAEQEKFIGTKIGSTLKGVGAALQHKIARLTDVPVIARDVFKGTPLERYLVNADEYDCAVDESSRILVEGAQGFSLSINQGFYPYVTSRDCTTNQILSDCGLPPLDRMEGGDVVYGVCRTYPIRVNNRDHWSGPCFEDQEETSWEAIGVEPELTTVTKLPRRVFTFSRHQIMRAIRMNGVQSVFLNFCNYQHNDEDTERLISTIEEFAPVDFTGWGPKVTDIRVRS